MSRKKTMSSSVVLLNVPSMGESVSQVVVGRLLVDSGDFVEAGQDVVELETDKVNQTLNAPSAGLIDWQVEVGETIAIGTLLAKIEREDSQLSKKEKLPEVKEGVEAPKNLPTLPGMNVLDRAKSDKGVSKESVSKIRIPREQALLESPMDVQKNPVTTPLKNEELVNSSEPIQLAPSGFKEARERLPQMRKTIAQRLLKAQQEAAMLTTFNEIDMSAVMQMREKFAEKFLKKHGVKLGFMSFFAKAVVSALKKVPSLNARIEGDEWVQRLDYHLGVAVSTEKGLVVPVIRDCDILSLADIEKHIAAMALKAREGKITLGDLQGGSFTITNGGVFGSLLSTPILNPPQSGILGMHKIQKRPVVNEKDEIVVRPMMYLALTYDHRVVDGKQAVSFLVAIKEAIEQPEVLWLEI